MTNSACAKIINSIKTFAQNDSSSKQNIIDYIDGVLATLNGVAENDTQSWNNGIHVRCLGSEPLMEASRNPTCTDSVPLQKPVYPHYVGKDSF